MGFLYKHRLFITFGIFLSFLSAYFTLWNTEQNLVNIYSICAFLALIALVIFSAVRYLSRDLRHINTQQKVELNARNAALEQLVQGKPLSDILETIVLAIEQSDAADFCSILLLDDDGKHLLTGAAPSLPDFYNTVVHGLEIGDGVGSCGTAAFKQERVIVEDIQNNSYWEAGKELAAKANLGSCWSEPIIDHTGQLLGTFAIYHRQATSPKETHLNLINSTSRLVAFMIAHKRADEEQQLTSRVFNVAQEGIMVTDAQGYILAVNPMFTKITGYSRNEVLGKNASLLKSGRHDADFYADMWHSLHTLGEWQGEVWNCKKHGQIYVEQLSISSLLDESGKAHRYVGLFSDITQSKDQLRALEVMAHYDVLTNLPNRALFSDRFIQEISHSKRNNTLLAVCYLDLDDFKPINDNYGHKSGDKLLIEVADRLRDTLREEDTISRQGGDEFALLLSNFESVEQCEQLLMRIHRVLAEPYEIAGATHYISASSGTTIYPIDDADIDTLIRHADQAMYKAKLAGKNHHRIFDAGDDKKIMTHHSKLLEIKHALENNQFILYYQPKVNMQTGDVFGAEALIRWLHPEKGLIPPLSFLPLVNNTDLEIDIGNWVINEALNQMELWQQQGIELEISVNISSYHLQSASFITQLNEALLRHPKAATQRFQLEVLESSTLADIKAISSIIKTCQDLLGLSIALDDFGTGYSSLAHLRNLHANIIKIDQSFIRNMLDDPDDYAIIEGVISLAESFDRKVIAEGVESSDHGVMLMLMGCEQAQGYGISHPLPAADLVNWLKEYQPNQEWLRYGDLQMTMQETKVKLLSLTTYHWYKAFSQKQLTPTSNTQRWPLMNPKQCHHGAWLKRARKEQLFDSEWLKTLDQAHDNMHLVATDIMIKHQNKNEGLVTSEDLDKVHLAFEKMNHILETN